MGVYVDDVRLPFRGRIMCHMIADTTEELYAMAAALGLARRWIQRAGTPEEHFDVAIETKVVAIELGAIQITRRELIWKIRARRPSEEGSGGVGGGGGGGGGEMVRP